MANAKSRLRRIWRLRPLLLYALVVLCVLLAGWSALGNWLAVRTDAGLPRNPETGILVDAEPFDLGPQDGDRAVLFVHGFVAAPNTFWELPARVAERGWRAKGILLPGHGTSPFDFEKTTADESGIAAYKTVELGESVGRARCSGALCCSSR